VRNFWFACVELEKSRSEWIVVEKPQNRRFRNFKFSYLGNGLTKIKNSKRFLISTKNCLRFYQKRNKCKIKNGRSRSEKVDSYREWLLSSMLKNIELQNAVAPTRICRSVLINKYRNINISKKYINAQQKYSETSPIRPSNSDHNYLSSPKFWTPPKSGNAFLIPQVVGLGKFHCNI